ncbi:serine protease [Sphingobacterium sp. HMA12]|jgi:hypothetical protein|uniref:S1 family peptidase n=1 Tax=Sphingobacterium sp. HMA12 TaxID=2050894 RepID=UPI000CEA5415|nr:serine protease [Sphingobacterium sp. HMA12]
MKKSTIYTFIYKKLKQSFNTSAAIIVFIALVGFVFQSCNKDNAPNDAKDTSTIPRMEDVLEGNDRSLIDLLHKIRGSVGTRGPASKTIWSRKNNYFIGLYISANHVYNLSGWRSRDAEFFDLLAENIGIFETSQIPQINGNINLGDILIADFPLMHFDISPKATNTTIAPSEDFYLGVIDNQRIKRGPLPRYPDFVQTAEELQLYDPNDRTTALETWSIPVAGEKAIAVGYPQDRASYPNGAVVYGKILSDIEARDIIQKLISAGDSEGDIPYRPEAEFFIEVQTIAGMSGGGVFNSAGQLLGIMVRASEKKNAPKITRVVKTAYIQSKMVELYNTLSEADKIKLRPFISGEL